MNQVAAGDPAAQRALAQRLAGRVRRLSRLLLRDPAESDDAAQVSLVEILRSAHSFRSDASVERWADRITSRTVMRHARAHRQWWRTFGGLLDVEQGGGLAFAWFVRERTPRALEDYLQALSPARRQAFVLKHAMGHTVEEIADITETTTGTVKDRLVAARKQLRRLIDRDLATAARRSGR